MKVPTKSLQSLSLWAALAALGTPLAGAACAGNGHDAAADPDEVTERSERDTYEDSADGEQGDWQWQGERQDCFFVYENECFSQMAEACDAAGCDEEVCTHDDSAPAEVSCPEE